MAEIRANREYKFKEFCISEEIPKSPPVKTKRWTFHDTSLNRKIYNRPAGLRKWDEKGSDHVNWSSESNMNQQFVKTSKKPESHLRAEFFNAYKKYYRRVDIKRLEVESTLNVDANEELAEGESSLYKEKECMEINIVMDTDKDDALVSSKVRRTVLCVSPGEETPCGVDNIRSDKKTIEVPEELVTGNQNIVLDETVADDSAYSSYPERSSFHTSFFPVTSEQKYLNPEKHATMTSRLKQEEVSLSRKFVPFAENPQTSKNIESQKGRNSFHQGLLSASCNDIDQSRDSLANDLGSSVCQHLTQMEAGKKYVNGVNELIQNDEKNKYVKSLGSKFCKSTIQFNTVDPPYSIPSQFRIPEEKSSTSDIYQNTKSDFKRSINSSNCDGIERKSPPGTDNFVPFMFDDCTRNRFNHNTNIIDSNKRIVDLNELKSDSNEILAAQKPLKKYLLNETVSGGYNREHWTAQSNHEPAKKVHNSLPTLSNESARERTKTESLCKTKNNKGLISNDEFSNMESGVRFRGLRGSAFNASNKKVLKSFVVNVIQNDPNDAEKNSKKRESNTFSQKEKADLAQQHETTVVSNLEGRNHKANSQKSVFTDAKLVMSNHQDSSCQCKTAEVSEKNHNQKRSSDCKNISCDERLFISERRQTMEEPFVIWTNKNSIDPTESLKITKLKISQALEVGSEYDNNSESFSFWHGVSENSEKNQQKEETYSGEVTKTASRNKGKEDGKFRKGKIIPERRYTFAFTENSTPKYLPHENWEVSDSKYENECQKSEISRNRVIASHDCKEGSQDEAYKFVAPRGVCGEVIFDKKQRSGSNVCVEGKSQLAPQTITYEIKSTTNDSNRISYGQEKDAVNIKKGYNDLDQSDKQNLKSSNSDFLQIGPTYSVHYSPPLKKISGKGQIWEETVQRCHGGTVDACHCKYANEKDYIHEKRNKTQSGNSCNHTASLIWDNYCNGCNSDMICNAHHETNSESKSRGHHNSVNNNSCNCDSTFHRIVRNNSACTHHVWDKNVYCHYRNGNNCSMNNKLNTHNGCPLQDGNRKCWQDENRNCCQGENRNCCRDININCCQECNDEQMRVRFRNRSPIFPKPNNMFCSCPLCLAERSTEAACVRKGLCCSTWSVDKQLNYSFPGFDGERQWMSTGHQPLRAPIKCSTVRNIAQTENQEIKEAVRKGSEKHPPTDSLYNPSRLQNPEVYAPENHKTNDSYIYEREPKIVCQLECTENYKTKNNSFTDVKTEQKYHHNSVNCHDFNLPDLVDNSDIQGEFKHQAPERMPCGSHGTKPFTSNGKTHCFTNRLNSYKGKTNFIEAPLKGSDGSISEPLFLCEEQWDSDDGLPIRKIVRKAEGGKEEADSSGFRKEPIYLEDEHWESGDEEIRENEGGFLKDFHQASVCHSNDFNYQWEGRRSADSQLVERNGNFLEEDSRKCSSVHAVSDPSFYCEEQWASDEEKCEDHKFQSTLPKNRTKKRKGRDRRSFNPRRWDMVTDLPKNEYIAKQNRDNYRENNYERENFGNSMVFENRTYYNNNNN